MGSPKKIKKKYQTPRHPWQKARIDAEKIIFKEYAFKNKKELWKQQSFLRKYTRQAKRLINLQTEQAKKEKEQIINKLFKLGLLSKTSKIDDVLSLTLKDVLERRLQTIMFKKHFSKTIKQARQFITHHHVLVNNKKITSPSYLVLREEEDKITFNLNSALKNPEHPEREIEKKKEVKVQKTMPKKEIKKIEEKKVEKKQIKKEEKKETKKVEEKKDGKNK
ncbi:MAG: 30S ribosomal protein S4 [Nanoarchaeota archaeon]|nr:30S ribosomal protein S4 [Nanoarchaeota archaeon]